MQWKQTPPCSPTSVFPNSRHIFVSWSRFIFLRILVQPSGALWDTPCANCIMVWKKRFALNAKFAQNAATPTFMLISLNHLQIIPSLPTIVDPWRWNMKRIHNLSFLNRLQAVFISLWSFCRFQCQCFHRERNHSLYWETGKDQQHKSLALWYFPWSIFIKRIRSLFIFLSRLNLKNLHSKFN